MASTFFYHFAYNFVRDRRLASHAASHGGKTPRVLGVFEELSVGAVAGIFSRFLTSPASNIVTRKQVKGGSSMQIIHDIYRESGITGFWSGFRASVVLSANPSITYYLFELQKALIVPRSRRDNPKAIEIFMLSAIGKAIATLLLYPFILTKTRMQAKNTSVTSTTLMKRLFMSEGILGMYKGCGPQVLKGFLAQGIMMLVKEKIGALIVTLYLMVQRNRLVNLGATVKHTALDVAQRAGISQNLINNPKEEVGFMLEEGKEKVEAVLGAAVNNVRSVAENISDATPLKGKFNGLSNAVESGKKSIGDGMQAAGKYISNADTEKVVTDLKNSSESIADATLKKAGETLKSAGENLRHTDAKEVAQKAQQAASSGSQAMRNVARTAADSLKKSGVSQPNYGAETTKSTTSSSKTPVSSAPKAIEGAEWSDQTRKPKT